MNKKDRKNWIYMALIPIAFVIAGIYQQMAKTELLELPQKYVVGTVIDKRYPSRGEPIVLYQYSFREFEYQREEAERKIKLGGRYLVSIPEGHEDNGFILLDYPVPEGVKSPPYGWDEIPEF